MQHHLPGTYICQLCNSFVCPFAICSQFYSHVLIKLVIPCMQ
uniref:Uncharacterized protein n=1 Tax=Arundo donax TaxID=35708 RepID=A0A0A8ZNN1_ARUDO